MSTHTVPAPPTAPPTATPQLPTLATLLGDNGQPHPHILPMPPQAPQAALAAHPVPMPPPPAANAPQAHQTPFFTALPPKAPAPSHARAVAVPENFPFCIGLPDIDPAFKVEGCTYGSGSHEVPLTAEEVALATTVLLRHPVYAPNVEGRYELRIETILQAFWLGHSALIEGGRVSCWEDACLAVWRLAHVWSQQDRSGELTELSQGERAAMANRMAQRRWRARNGGKVNVNEPEELAAAKAHVTGLKTEFAAVKAQWDKEIKQAQVRVDELKARLAGTVVTVAD